MSKCILLLCMAVCIIAATACHKHDSDDELPVITINTPTAAQAFNNGQPVAVSALVTDNSLHEVRITITAQTGGAVLFSKIIDAHNLTTCTVSENWVNNVSAVTAATVKVEAEDHGEHTVEKSVQITLQP